MMGTKTVKLVGPEQVVLSFVLDGVTYRVANGTVSPDMPEGSVPDVLFGLGFSIQADKAKAKPEEGK